MTLSLMNNSPTYHFNVTELDMDNKTDLRRFPPIGPPSIGYVYIEETLPGLDIFLLKNPECTECSSSKDYLCVFLKGKPGCYACTSRGMTCSHHVQYLVETAASRLKWSVERTKSIYEKHFGRTRTGKTRKSLPQVKEMPIQKTLDCAADQTDTAEEDDYEGDGRSDYHDGAQEALKDFENSSDEPEEAEEYDDSEEAEEYDDSGEAGEYDDSDSDCPEWAEKYIKRLEKKVAELNELRRADAASTTSSLLTAFENILFLQSRIHKHCQELVATVTKHIDPASQKPFKSMIDQMDRTSIYATEILKLPDSNKQIMIGPETRVPVVITDEKKGQKCVPWYVTDDKIWQDAEMEKKRKRDDGANGAVEGGLSKRRKS
ncbi:hypothetical protein BYT27DRAFT_7246139 [Phlegmacium glaucopus]|nr:hypothetical protein BYT27DRAFT_7246139 [Phlegmacium glaucopus]